RMVGFGSSLCAAAPATAAALATMCQKTPQQRPSHRSATAQNLSTPDRPPTQSQKNAAQAAPLRTQQARHTAQKPHSDQNRFLKCPNPRLYRNRSGGLLYLAP